MIQQFDKQLIPDFALFKANPCSKCQEGWEEDGGQCYFFSMKQSNWAQAREECRQQGGDLVRIMSREKQVHHLATALLSFVLLHRDFSAPLKYSHRNYVFPTTPDIPGESCERKDEQWWGQVLDWFNGRWNREHVVVGGRIGARGKVWPLWTLLCVCFKNQRFIEPFFFSMILPSLSFWGMGQPDNWAVEDTNGEDCVRMGERGSRAIINCWLDKSCKFAQRSICEKPATPGHLICVWSLVLCCSVKNPSMEQCSFSK